MSSKAETKWTPGPWRAKEYDEFEFGIEPIGLILHLPDWADPEDWERDKANASLIATAPDLYAFVQRQFEATACICNFKAAGYTEMPCTHCEARALLARARGEEPEGGTR